jgi:hypothetical protein
MTNEHAIKCLDGELYQLERVRQRLVDRRADYELARERYKQALNSWNLMQERIAFIELTLAEHDG